MEGRLLENQQSINQKFETIIRDVADLKGRLEGMLGKFDLYLKLGENKYGKENCCNIITFSKMTAKMVN